MNPDNFVELKALLNAKVARWRYWTRSTRIWGRRQSDIKDGSRWRSYRMSRRSWVVRSCWPITSTRGQAKDLGFQSGLVDRTRVEPAHVALEILVEVLVGV